MKGVIDYKALCNTSESTRIFRATGEWPVDSLPAYPMPIPIAIVEIDQILADLIQRIEVLEGIGSRDLEGGAV
jgi:hypothetical protein